MGGRSAVTGIARVAIPAVVVALASLWLYRRALGFAYFNDDPTGHFAWMEGRSLLQFFTSSADYGYYRPVVFAVLRLSEILFGNVIFPHNPVADHALLWLLHGLNTALVWLLAYRLSGRAVWAWAVALLFAATPFSYEAVAYVASLTHPLLLFWLLAALLLYDRGRLAERRSGEEADIRGAGGLKAIGYRAAALSAMVLGLLTHENGLFIFPALVGFDWVVRPHSSFRARARSLGPFAVPPALFVVLWLVIPKNSQQGLNSLTDVAHNAIPFLQTLVYPLLPMLRLGSGDTAWLMVSAIVVVAMAGGLAWRVGALRLWFYALAWFILSAAPALLFLGPAYVYGSPRLSYLPSVGVAMLWGMPVLWLASRFSGRRPVGYSLACGALCGALCALYLLILIIPPLSFIRCQLDFYDEASRFARDMARAAGDAPAGREVVFVNAPFFFSSTADRPEGCPSPYPWTPVGAVLIPPYAQARDFARFNGGPDRDVSGVTFAGYNPGWRTFGPEIEGQALRRHAADDATYVFDLQEGAFGDLSAAWQPSGAALGDPLAAFGGLLSLADVWSGLEDAQLVVRLEWRIDETVETPLVAFVHIYDAAGVLAAQSDEPPGNGLAPLSLWRPGDVLRDERRLDLSSLPAGSYRAAVGVYRAADGLRLTAESGGRPIDDDVLQIRLMELP